MTKTVSGKIINQLIAEQDARGHSPIITQLLLHCNKDGGVLAVSVTPDEMMLIHNIIMPMEQIKPENIDMTVDTEPLIRKLITIISVQQRALMAFSNALDEPKKEQEINQS